MVIKFRLRQAFLLSLLLLVLQVTAQVEPIANGKKKFLGNVYSSAQLPGFTSYWNQVTPENGGKWGSVERTKDVMNWNELDAAYKLAKDNGFPFKLHVLIWGSQQPSWIENMTATEQYNQIEEWFLKLAERYPSMDQIEVVNEPLHQPPTGAGKGNYSEALGGSGQSGWDWVITAFRMARQIFPNAQLLINDYGIINDGNAVNRYITIINLLKKEELIDAIGFQGHAFNTGASSATLKANLDKLATIGLPVFVTELDIDGPTDQVQLDDYKRIFPIFWEHSAVQGITLWGYRPGLWRNTQKAYLINPDGSERPSLKWLREYVQGSFVSVDELRNSPDIVVYPNPVLNNEIHFDGIETIKSVHLYHLSGKLIKTQATNFESTMIFEMDVQPGMYLLQFYDGINVFNRKVVVK